MNDLSIDSLKDQVHEGLSLWHKGSGAGAPLADLLLYRTAQAQENNERRVTNRLLLDAISSLEHDDTQAAIVLRMRFADDQPAQIVANRLNVSEGHVFKKQREAIEQLAEILLTQEMAARSALFNRLIQRLEPPTYTKLFGADASLTTLYEILNRPGPPWFVSIEGIGGIGKTSLTHALVHAMIRDGTVGWRTFANLAWVTARSQVFNAGGALSVVDRPTLSPEQLIYDLADQLLPDVGASRLSLKQTNEAVAQTLRAAPHLVVVDNLESQADVMTVLETVRPWAGPTKFLLTSRRSMIGEDSFFHFRLPDLCQADALALLRHQAALRNQPAIAQADDAELACIVRTVGGNPLALRLVVGQTLVHSLPGVLEDLAGAKGQAVENLYTYIYRRAWNHLGKEERETLLLMPLIHENGSDLDYLARIAQRPPSELRSVLWRLVGLNLVDSVGGLTDRRFTIHNLTRSFLQEQVLRWIA